MLAERRLDAEQKRFNAGMSTNFLVTQAQRDLSLAEVAEIQAISDYRNSVVNFERVQEAGGNGVTFVGSSVGTFVRQLARLRPASEPARAPAGSSSRAEPQRR